MTHIFLKKQLHFRCKNILVLAATHKQARMLLRELADENRDDIVRYYPDRVYFKDGYIFIARSFDDSKGLLGIAFCQVITSQPIFNALTRATLDSVMDKYGVPEEFRWIVADF